MKEIKQKLPVQDHPRQPCECGHIAAHHITHEKPVIIRGEEIKDRGACLATECECKKYRADMSAALRPKVSAL